MSRDELEAELTELRGDLQAVEEAREERAPGWQEESSETLADGRFRETFLRVRGAVDPDTDLEI